jgi:recombinational DNA repair protein RecR
MTKEEVFAEACNDIQGTCDMGNERAAALAHHLDQEIEDISQELLDEFNTFCEERGVQDCDVCGWVTFEGEGSICSECEENDEYFDLDEDA